MVKAAKVTKSRLKNATARSRTRPSATVVEETQGTEGSLKPAPAVSEQTAKPSFVAPPSSSQIKLSYPMKLTLLAVIMLVSIIGTVLGMRYIANTFPGSSDSSASADSTPAPQPIQPLSVALLGYGGGDHDGGALTDTIILAWVHPEYKTIVLISIPRDLWVPLSLKKDSAPVWGKINTAFAIGSDQALHTDRDTELTGVHGGGLLAKSAVAQVTGIQPTYYAAVNFDTFISAVDSLGGISVNVPYTFDDYFYPLKGMEKDPCDLSEEEIASMTATLKGFDLEKQFPCRYEHLHFDAGETLMDGETALKFARSRHSAVGGSDFGRAQRQQAVIQAVKDKVFSLSFLPKAIPLAQDLYRSISTDVQLNEVGRLFSIYTDLKSYTLYSITLTDANVLGEGRSIDRQYILQPRGGQEAWEGIHTYIQEEIDTATASASKRDQQDPELAETGLEATKSGEASLDTGVEID